MTKILIVDDSPVDLRFATKCVEAEGVNVVVAENGLRALEVIPPEKPDVVLTDLQMPELDGLELVRHIKREHPTIPVILMTAHGSEDVAVQALRAGAASYVPKKNLQIDLSWALRNVLAAAETARDREQIRSILTRCENHYLLGYETNGPRMVVSHLQEGLAQMEICDSVGRLQCATALSEALANAIDHGNLELDSILRETDARRYRQLGLERSSQEPYKDRRVRVNTRIDREQAVISVEDDGPGFDPDTLPDPTDPENLLKPSGRGVMLIRTFMDSVSFNDKGNEIIMTKRRANSEDE
jgi:CheY-like chemotaxis protein/anti-sigma regulatory factor (Ser/Thr protein kinase)